MNRPHPNLVASPRAGAENGPPGAIAAFLTRRGHLIVLAFIVAVALFLRLYGIDWDQGGLYHPDERAILMRVDKLGFPLHDLGSLFTKESPLNPAWFPYGSFPLYLLKLTGFLAPPFLENPAFHELAIIGRATSAVFDVATVVLVYVVAARFFGKWPGVMAAAAVALSALHIQQSHFFVTDIMLASLLMASFYFLTRVMERGSRKDFILAGLFFGLALATKVSSFPFGVAFATAGVLYAVNRSPGSRERPNPPPARHEPETASPPGPLSISDGEGVAVAEGEALGAPRPHRRGTASHQVGGGSGERRDRVRTAVLGIALAAVVTALVFVVTQPYAVIDYRHFFGDVGEQSRMVRRLVDYPYTRQYVDTTPYLYQMRQLVLWGMGVPMGILMWAGLAFSAGAAVLRRRREHILLLSWVVPYFLITGSFDVKFMRYMLPITPFLAIMAVGMVGWTARRLRDRAWRFIDARLAYAVLAIVMVFTAFCAFAYVNIYSRPHTAEATSDWMVANVTPGSKLLQDSGWEEGFRRLERFDQSRMEVYDDDTPEKRARMIDRLSWADYLLFYSNRQYGTIPRLPDRYPMTTAYYQELFSGELGFQLAHWESSYPNLYGISFAHDTFGPADLPIPPPMRDYKQTSPAINLGQADESFTVYDHPLTLVFKKTLTGTPDQQRAYFEGKIPHAPAQAGLGPASGKLILSPEDARAQQEGGTWSDLFNRHSLVNKAPAFFWYLLIQVAFLVTLPVTLLVFRRLPDRGYLLGKVLAVLLMAYIPWLLASLHVLAFSRASIALGLVAIAVASGGIWRFKGGEMLAFLKENKRLILISEGLFLLALVGFYLIRTWDPDLWHPFRGGEKPMDFAYFNAVIRSTYMPPYDPWFSGGYLNYYYFGQFMSAVPTKLLGILPEKAVILVVPLFFAMAAAAAFSLVYNLTTLLKGKMGDAARTTVRGQIVTVPESSAEPGGQPADLRGVLRRVPSPIWAGLLAAGFVCVMGNLDGIVQVAQGIGHVMSGQPFGAFDYWRSSRMMPPDPPGFEITEFPYFTFLFADPHAHLFVIPLTLLALGLALALVMGKEAPSRWLGHTAVLPLAFLGLTLGAILATNSWDVLTYAVVAGVAVVIAEYVARRRLSLQLFLWSGVKIIVLAALLGLFFLPYLRSYQPPIAAVSDNVLSGVPLIGKVADAFANTFHRDQTLTVLYQYMAIHAVFVFLLFSLLAFEWWRRYNTRNPPPLPGGRLDALSRALGWRWAAYISVGLLGITLLSANGYATIGFLLGMLMALAPLALVELRSPDEGTPPRLLLYAMAGVALLLGVFVDLFTFAGDIERLNTVFKFYLQAWVLFALASAYALWRLKFGQAIPWKLPRIGWQAFVALLVACALIYPIMATPVRSRDRFNALSPTTDGMAYMDKAVYSDKDQPIELIWDRQGIEWMRDNVRGSPVIVEGITPLYRWGNRVSVYTGLPDVIGWDNHQKQQRGDYAGKFSGVDQRRREVDAFFNTSDATFAKAFLSRYGVKYIYVGRLERIYYPKDGLAKFDSMLDHGLELAYENPQVRIYRVVGG